MKLPSQIVGNIGLYYVCYRLSALGWNVMPTARNTPGIDIVCFNDDGKTMLSIQVKSLTKRVAVPLGKNIEKKVKANFWIIVNSVQTCHPRAYVLLPSEVKTRAHDGSDGQWWLNRKDYAVDEFEEQWERLGEPMRP